MLDIDGSAPPRSIQKEARIRFFRERGRGPETNDAFDFHAYVESCLAVLRELRSAHIALWHIDRAQRFAVDQDTGSICWYFVDGRVVTAPVQIIGTSNPNDGTFLWAWDHPSVVPGLDEHAKLVKRFGEEHGVEKLVTRQVEASENGAWEFAAIATRLAGANGAHRADAGGPLVYRTFGTLTMRRLEAQT